MSSSPVPVRNNAVPRRIVLMVSAAVLLGACNGSSSGSGDTSVVRGDTSATDASATDTSATGSSATESSATESSVAGQGGTGASKLVPGPDTVTIQYFVAKGNPPLLKETPKALDHPTTSVSMLVTDITYAGVVCGFSFTGADRPTPPVEFRMQIERADGTVVDGHVDVGWEGDVEKPGSAQVEGWSFLSDAQVNRNGPGWVVQVGAVPLGGGKGKEVPSKVLCTLTSKQEMPVTVGPVSYWAGFATV